MSVHVNKTGDEDRNAKKYRKIERTAEKPEKDVPKTPIRREKSIEFTIRKTPSEKRKGGDEIPLKMTYKKMKKIPNVGGQSECEKTPEHSPCPLTQEGGDWTCEDPKKGELDMPRTTYQLIPPHPPEEGHGDGPGERPGTQGDSPGPKNQPGPKTQNKNDEKLKPVKKMNKFWEDWATKNKEKHEKLDKKEENKEKLKPNLGKSPKSQKKKTKEPKLPPKNEKQEQKPTMTVTVKGKKYTYIKEFLRQRAEKKKDELRSTENLPNSSGSAAERGIGDTADTA